MKRLGLLVCSLLAVCALNGLAIDRDARMIDRVNLDLSYLDDADSIGGSVLGETALNTPRKDWAVLFGGGLGTISPLNEDNADYWNVLLGLKFYLLPETSISGFGKYEQFDVGSTDRDAKGVTLQLKQRFLPADAPLSPFAMGSATLRDRSTFTDSGTEDSFSEYIFGAGGGCEFSMTDELSFEFSGSYQVANASDDGSEDLDGWNALFGMIYYWR